MRINYFNDTDFPRLPKAKIIEVAKSVFDNEIKVEGVVNVIFVRDEAIKEINTEYLSHDCETDVISFIIDDDPFLGEIYISAETAEKQANEYGVSLTNELMRLTAHGALHLCGYDDGTEADKEAMHKLENKYIGNL
ncbi:MAG: rRNA maturation RNase YbeY [bacterium]